MTKKLHDSMSRPLVEDNGAGGHEPYVRLDDGGIPAIGTTTDAPFVGTEDGTARTVVSILKGIKNSIYVSLLAILGATTGAAVVTDDNGTIQQYLRGLVKLIVAKITVSINQTTLGSTNAVYSAPAPQTPTSYRTAVVAADVMAVPGTVTCTKLTGVGSLTAGVYNIKVVAINAFGRTTATAGNVAVTTETTNLGVRAAFAQVTGATHYDIYCSTDSDPKFTGRITEAQRASGIIISTHNVTSAGGAAGAVDIYPVGTGLQAATTAAQNAAYVIPASPVNCAGYSFVDFDLTYSRTGDDAAPSLTVAPAFYNSRLAAYKIGQPIQIQFGGVATALGSMCQRIRVECRGNSAVALIVQNIAGTGMSVDMDAVLS